MRGLPPVLDKVRMKLKKEDIPPFVLHIRDFEAIPRTEEIARSAKDDNIPILGISHWWLEFSDEEVRVGMLIRAEDQKEMRIKVYGGRGEWMDTFSFNPWDPLKNMPPGIDNVSRARRLIGSELIRVMHYLWLTENTPAAIPVTTGMRNMPTSFTRVGDTLRYARVESLRTTSGQQRDYVPPEEPSGIRKREHGVRGHWRTYRTGVKVWVREHKRGDPALGRVTRVIC